MNRTLRSLVLTALLSGAALGLTPEQQARVQHVGSNLRCPICTGVPITESPNDISREMLRGVREQVAAGKSDREIYAYFAARYGNFVLLDPPKEGSNLLLWGAPLLALGAGGAVLWSVLRRRGGAAAAAETATATEGWDQTVQEPNDPYLEQVRRETGRRPDGGQP